MSTTQTRIVQDSFASGSFHDTAPYLIPEDGVKELVDAWVEEDGAAIERGGTVVRSNAAFGTGLRWIHDCYFDAGVRTVFASDADFGVLASDDATPVNLGSDGLTAPKPSALIAGLLFIGGGYIYAGSRKTANYSAGTVTVSAGSNTVTGASTAWTTNLDAGMLFQIGDERVYVIASVVSDTELTLRTEKDANGVTVGYQGTPGGGKSYVARNIYKITTADPYPAAEFYSVTANRLVWAESNFAKAAEPGNPHDLTATIGGVEIPTVHELPYGERITGLATSGQTALVFTTAGIWTLDGLAFDVVDANGGAQHRLAKLSGQHILWEGAGIVGWEQALVVPCIDGIYLLDGISQPQRISRPFDLHITEYVGNGWRTGQAAVERGHYLLPVYSGAVRMRDLLVCRINRRIDRRRKGSSYPWTHFARHAGELIAFTRRVGDTTTREPKLLGASAAADARIVTCPFFEQGYPSDADGQVPTLDLISRAIPTGNDTTNVVRNVRARYELVDTIANNNPELRLSYSLGESVSGLPTYDSGFDYDEDHLYSDDQAGEGAFTSLPCRGAESDGRDPLRCRVNERTRFFQLRVRNPDPSNSCKVRSLDVRVRPSKAVRI